MYFVRGFSKIANIQGQDAHNDGRPFNIADNEPAAYSPPGNIIPPTGLDRYAPTGETLLYKRPSAKSFKEEIAKKIVMGKLAQDFSISPTGPGYVGSRMDTASGVSEQLKYEVSSNEKPELFGYNGDAVNQKRLRIARRGAKKNG